MKKLLSYILLGFSLFGLFFIVIALLILFEGMPNKSYRNYYDKSGHLYNYHDHRI